ncbi:hypothetical protein Syun_025553 [Stephania yunnanensis]|uniref:Uncharacterized protein n=1 Tax=Stephania yunnanensis TaxID=152371 RepID=A0AAP0EXE8_9MAGN
MAEALARILTPRLSIDILRDVHAAEEQRRPYLIVFVGVNGQKCNINAKIDKAKVTFTLNQLCNTH